MPTLIDALRDYVQGTDDIALYDSWFERIVAYVDAYDALAPDWSQAPEWAQWYALSPSGGTWWFEGEPTPDLRERAGWRTNGGIAPGVRIFVLPLGLDWRLCLWPPPAALYAVSRDRRTASHLRVTGGPGPCVPALSLVLSK